MREFDPQQTGGYRDMLVNLRCKVTGHIVEMQLTLEKLLAIKEGVAYTLGRALHLFDPEVNTHFGVLVPTLEKVKHGVIHSMTCIGPCQLIEHFDLLCQSLQSSLCTLSKIGITEAFCPGMPKVENAACASSITISVAGCLPPSRSS